MGSVRECPAVWSSCRRRGTARGGAERTGDEESNGTHPEMQRLSCGPWGRSTRVLGKGGDLVRFVS